MGSKVLIVAAPRSGTRYTTVLLGNCGLNATHEVVFSKDGFTQWHSDVDVSWRALMQPESLSGCQVLHQVRNPLRQISSWQTMCRYTVERYKKDLRQDMAWHPFQELLPLGWPTAAVAYWVEFNQLIERVYHAPPFFKVEEAESAVPLVAQMLGVEVDDETLRLALEATPKDTNRHPELPPASDRILEWDDLPESEWKVKAKELAAKYGY